MKAEDKSRALFVVARRCAAAEPGMTEDRLRQRAIELMCDLEWVKVAGEALDYAEELFAER